MQKRYHFISGLPRSGSTLLTAILNQNPRFHSEISDLLCLYIYAIINFKDDPGARTFSTHERMKNIYQSMIDGWYQHIDKEVCFNTSRYWNMIPEYLYHLNPNFKIICCVRDVNLILNSVEKLYKSKHLSDALQTQFYDSSMVRHVWGRTDSLLGADGFVRKAYDSLKECYYGKYRDHLLLVEYDLLTKYPKETMQHIYDFIEEPYFDHDFENVHYSNVVYDDDMRISNLHKVHSKVEYIEPKIVLPPELMEKYSNWEFWRN
jgi:sulfotransferase